MHKAFGVSKQECLDMLCESNQIVLKIQTPAEKLCCPVCGSHHVVRNRSTLRRFVSVPFGAAKTYLEMKAQRLRYCDCGAVKQEDIDFAKGKRRHTLTFFNMVPVYINPMRELVEDMQCNVCIQQITAGYNIPTVNIYHCLVL